MKKLSSMLALGLALALTFGMTVSAKESPTTEGTAPSMTEAQQKDYTQKSSALTQAVGSVTATVDGKSVTLTKEPVAPETLYQAERLADDKAAEKAAALKLDVPKGATVKTTVVGSADLKLPEGTEMPEAGITLTIPISGIKEGKTYVLLHLANGTWETIVPKSVVNGAVEATFKSLSPVVASEVFVVVAEEEKEEDDDDVAAVPAAAAAVNPATSPKTAETLPVAGVMALICLAGAAVCAGKVRYNK